MGLVSGPVLYHRKDGSEDGKVNKLYLLAAYQYVGQSAQSCITAISPTIEKQEEKNSRAVTPAHPASHPLSETG